MTRATDRDLQALAYLATRHRPHGAPRWDQAGTYTIIASHCANWDVDVATSHVLAHARDPKALTPAAIRGRFTPDNEPELTGPPRPPRREQECRVHAGQHAHNCPGCAADNLVQHPSTPPRVPPPGDTPPAAESIAAARAALKKETTP